MKQTNNPVRRLTIMAMLIVMIVLGNKFLAMQLPFLRVGLGFIPQAIGGFLLGPLNSVIINAVSDVVGTIIFPSGGVYFPGFTITAIFTGLIYGTLYNRPITYKRLIITVLIVNVVSTLLNTIWLYIMMGNAVYADLPMRIIKMLVIVPIQVIINHMILIQIEKRMEHTKSEL